MSIWVDADACPTVIRDILCRAAIRRQVAATFVANQPVALPRSPWLRAVQVAAGYDVADNLIVEKAQPGDLVITSDIPLASEVIARGAQVLSARGEAYTRDNIRSRLNMRDFMETMRASGVHGGGPPPLNTTDRQRFANGLDRYLAAYPK